MVKYSVSIGLNDKDSKKQEVTTKKALWIVQEIAACTFGFASVFTGKGAYTHNDGTLILENTIRIELYGADENKVFRFCENMKSRFNQESIFIEKTNVDTIMI